MNPSPRDEKNKKTAGREVEIDKGVYIIKGAAPKTGTKLTRDRVAGNFRSLNRRSGRNRPAEG